MQNLVSHVAEKANEAKAQAMQAQAEKHTVQLEAEKMNAMMHRMAQECNKRNEQFEQWKAAAMEKHQEQQMCRENAELDASQSKRALEELTKHNAHLQAKMEQMSAEYRSTIATASTDEQTVMSLRHVAEQYYRQLEECGGENAKARRPL